MNQQHVVSILMTAYNREKFIVEAIESVLASSYSNFELVVVDDCSTDSTVAIAQAYAAKDNRIKLYVNEKNLGDYPNRNKAASYATGYYIMHLDSDDVIYPDGIEKCVDCMNKFPEANFGMVNYFITESIVVEAKSAMRDHLFVKPLLTIGPGGTIIKRKFFEDIKGFPTEFGPSNDMYFNLKACALTSIVMLPFEFHFYRRHEGQEINTYYTKSNRYIYSNYAYMKGALNNLNLFLTEKEKQKLHYKNNRRFLINMVKYFLKTRSISNVKEALKQSGFGWKETFSAIFHVA